MTKNDHAWVISKLRKWGVPENYTYAVEEMVEEINSLRKAIRKHNRECTPECYQIEP